MNDYKKMIRILVYPNITHNSRGQDIEADSFVQVIKKQILLLNQIRDDLWFYLVLPKEVKSLKLSNTSQLIYPLPTYPPTMRSYFNVERFKKLIPHNLEFDLIFSHLPEQTKNILLDKRVEKVIPNLEAIGSSPVTLTTLQLLFLLI